MSSKYHGTKLRQKSELLSSYDTKKIADFGDAIKFIFEVTKEHTHSAEQLLGLFGLNTNFHNFLRGKYNTADSIIYRRDTRTHTFLTVRKSFRLASTTTWTWSSSWWAGAPTSTAATTRGGRRSTRRRLAGSTA